MASISTVQPVMGVQPTSNLLKAHRKMSNIPQITQAKSNNFLEGFGAKLH